MPSNLKQLIGQAERALHRLEDSLDASRAWIAEDEADALRRLKLRWDHDTLRKIERELGKRYD